ncbi:hypothetical protein [Alloprevotella tannerae]|uniref:hypothetical protein n=1 Tax=Alloprevotella tannerae TaxID=76122 RepID=UPI001EDBB16F|nr:hypothetical protein [Alloprevotella tannerae]
MIFEKMKSAPRIKLGGHKEQNKRNASADSSAGKMHPSLPRGIKVTGDDRSCEPITLMPCHRLSFAAPATAFCSCDGCGG